MAYGIKPKSQFTNPEYIKLLNILPFYIAFGIIVVYDLLIKLGLSLKLYLNIFIILT